MFAGGMSTSAETLTRPDGAPVRVLVVDDEQMLADLLASALRYEGWEVTTAGTGVAAVRAAQEIEPDVIVLDIMLPDFDGLEVMPVALVIRLSNKSFLCQNCVTGVPLMAKKGCVCGVILTAYGAFRGRVTSL